MNGLIVFLKVNSDIFDVVYAQSLDLDASKPNFIREVLEKCRRFCYHQRIVETVPQDFEHLLPNEPNIRYESYHMIYIPFFVNYND